MIKLYKTNHYHHEFEQPKTQYLDYSNPIIYQLEQLPKSNFDEVVLSKLKQFEVDVNAQTTTDFLTWLQTNYKKTNYWVNKIINILKGE